MSGPSFLLKIRDPQDDSAFTTVGGFRLTSQDTFMNRITGRGIFFSSDTYRNWVVRGDILAPLDLWLLFEDGRVEFDKFLITEIIYAGNIGDQRAYDITIQRVFSTTSVLVVPNETETVYGTCANTVAVPIEPTDEIIASITAVLIFNCVLPVTGKWSDLARKLHAAVLDGVKERN